MTVSTTYPNTITAANAQAGTSANGTAASAAVSGTSTLTQLAGNFTDFLSLLTTQLQNQDPTSPMDTSQFTSQLVQFTGVAEQINTNQTLTQLLTATVSQQLTQASSLVGQQVTFTGGTLPLQNSTAKVDFQTTGAEPVQVAVSDASGNVVQTATVNAVAGANTWTWNGTGPNGTTLPDGAYTVAVTNAGTAVPFQAVGTVTGAEQANQSVQLMFGSTAVPFGNVVSLTAATAAAAAAVSS
jgi:flagellar basal-body rod modification protein FlgD